MDSIFLIFVFLIAVLMRIKRRIKNRTRYFPLFSAVSHGSKPATLHMRFVNCPVGKGAVLQIFNELQMTLIEMQGLGYQQVSFVTHMCRERGTRELMKFMSAHQMRCEQKAFRKTPRTHIVLNKVVMFFRKKRWPKISPVSLYITISLATD